MNSKFKLFHGLSWIWISEICESLLNKKLPVFSCNTMTCNRNFGKVKEWVEIHESVTKERKGFWYQLQVWSFPPNTFMFVNLLETQKWPKTILFSYKERTYIKTSQGKRHIKSLGGLQTGILHHARNVSPSWHHVWQYTWGTANLSGVDLSFSFQFYLFIVLTSFN